MKPLCFLFALVLLVSCESYKSEIYYINHDGIIKIEHESFVDDNPQGDSSQNGNEYKDYFGIYTYDISKTVDSSKGGYTRKYSMIKDFNVNFSGLDDGPERMYNYIYYGKNEKNEIKITLNLYDYLSIKETCDNKKLSAKIINNNMKLLKKNEKEILGDTNQKFLHVYTIYFPLGEIVEMQGMNLKDGALKISVDEKKYYNTKKKFFNNKQWLNSKASCIDLSQNGNTRDIFQDREFYKELLGLDSLRPSIIIRNAKQLFDSNEELKKAKTQTSELKRNMN